MIFLSKSQSTLKELKDYFYLPQEKNNSSLKQL